MYYYDMSGIRIGFPLEENKEVIPDNPSNTRYLYIVEIQDGNLMREKWLPFSEIGHYNVDVLIVWALPDDIKEQLKNKGILVLKSEVKNYKEALLGYITGLRRFKPL